ncbi:NHLP-related RiPP peptide [Thermomonas sp.]
MTDGNTIPPAGLHPRLVKKLLDNLESNDDFRAMFAESPEKALRSIGYTDPWACMTLKAGTKLASPAQIKAQRHKLEDVMVGVQAQELALSEQEGF